MMTAPFSVDKMYISFSSALPIHSQGLSLMVSLSHVVCSSFGLALSLNLFGICSCL